ncbi:MAG TPA: SIMPL domain-containing protein [Allosphingosinicella sp.]|nr:SIMPL domain-containing protein [Allosphingosinicella sp.]
MILRCAVPALLAVAAVAAPAQPDPVAAVNGTRLDVTVTGEVIRVPDIVRINAGVSTLAATPGEAMRRNAEQMARARTALTRAGISDRDVQTADFRLQAEYRQDGITRNLTGYRVTNTMLIRLRSVANSGRVLDALVAEGVNEIDGPNMDFEDPTAALDEARGRAVTAARARADLYARAFGLRIRRVVQIEDMPAFRPSARDSYANSLSTDTSTMIDPGGRIISVTLKVVFELE